MTSRLRNFVLYWLPLIAYCALIYLQSSYFVPLRLPRFFLADKIVHFGMYALMGILFHRVYRTMPFFIPRLRLLVMFSIASAFLYGISDEIHQHFVPYREGDFFDAIADALGAACGVYLYHSWLMRRHIGTLIKNKGVSTVF